MQRRIIHFGLYLICALPIFLSGCAGQVFDTATGAQIIAGDTFAAFIDSSGKLTVLFSEGKEGVFDGKTFARFAEDTTQLCAITTDGTFVTDCPDTPDDMRTRQTELLKDAQENSGSVGLGGSDPDGMERLCGERGLKYVVSCYPYSYIAVTAEGILMAGGNTTGLSAQETAWTSLERVLVADNLTLGICADGTLLYSEPPLSFSYREKKTKDWENLVDIQMCGQYLVGLTADGTVCTESSTLEKAVSGWNGILAIAAADEKLLGLKEDGTVCTAQTNGLAIPETDEIKAWTDIVAIDANASYCIGLKTDGTVVYAGKSVIN